MTPIQYGGGAMVAAYLSTLLNIDWSNLTPSDRQQLAGLIVVVCAALHALIQWWFTWRHPDAPKLPNSIFDTNVNELPHNGFANNMTPIVRTLIIVGIVLTLSSSIIKETTLKIPTLVRGETQVIPKIPPPPIIKFDWSDSKFRFGPNMTIQRLDADGEWK